MFKFSADKNAVASFFTQSQNNQANKSKSKLWHFAAIYPGAVLVIDLDRLLRSMVNIPFYSLVTE